MSKVVTFGEIMMRLAPYNYEKFIQANQFQVTYGGGEANVAVSLAHFGHEVYFVTRLPKNPLGDAAENSLRKYGIRTDYIVRGGQRLGIYFLEHGASIRPSKVVYDRADSAVSQLETGMINWKDVFQGKDWFHITGITPAISPNCAEVAIKSTREAKNAGLIVSCDLNYRRKLWSKEEAKTTMTKLVEYVDVIVANEEDAADIFGIYADETDVTSGKLNVEKYKSVASKLKELCDVEVVTITLRESISASDNNWSALFYDGSEYLISREYPIHLIDRIGGGDSFAAGLIHGLLKRWDKKHILEFAVCASALKQTIPGDMNMVNEDEVMSIVKGDVSGRVQR